MRLFLKNRIVFKFYRIYRRIRFIRYKKKVIRQGLREASVQKKQQRTGKSSLSFRIYRISRIIRFLFKRYRKRRIERKILKNQEKNLRRIEQQEVRSKIRDKIRSDMDLEAARNKEEKLQQKFKRKKRSRLIRFFLSRQIYNAGRAIRNPKKYIFGIFIHRYRVLVDNKDERRNFLIISANSTVYFLLSYLVVYLISYLIQVLYALQFKYKIILFYYKIYYNITNEQWTPDSVKILYSAGPFSFLIAGLIFLIIYSKLRQDVKIIKLFFLWGFIHGIAGFFSPLLLGSLLNKGFGYVITYLYYRDTARMIFSIISIFILISTGVMSTKSFLISGNQYYNFIDKTNRRFFIFSQVLVPFISGTLLITIFRYPNSLFYGSLDQFYFEFFIMLTNGLIIIPILVTYRTFPGLYFEEDTKLIRINSRVLLIMLAMYLLVRISLSGGIHFG